MNIRSYRWVEQPEAILQSPAGVIAVLRPAQEYRRSGWAQILHWYGLTLDDDESECSGDWAITPANDKDWVVYSDSELRVVAHLLAGQLRRAEACLPSLHDFPDWLASRTPRSVLLLARPADLTYQELNTLLAAVDRIKESLLGIITAPDLAGFTMVAAKVLARRADLDSDITIDCMHQRLFVDGAPRLFSSAGVAAGLQTDCRSAQLIAHGEGGHLDLGKIVACGAWLDEETDANGNRVAGCELHLRCKRARKPGLELKPVVDLRARLLGLLSCNSISVAMQIYPSSVSLGLAAMGGYPSAVVGTTRGVEYGRSFGALVDTLFRTSDTVGETVRFLNDIQVCAGQPPAFVLLGDPLWSAPPVAPEKHDGAPADLHQTRLVTLPQPLAQTPDVVAAYVGRKRIKTLFHTANQSFAVVDHREPGPALVRSRREDLEAIRIRLTDLARRIGSARLLEHGLLHDYLRSPDTKSGLTDNFLVLQKARFDLEYLLVCAAAQCDRSRRSHLWSDAIETLDGRISQCTRHWDDALTAIATRFLWLEDIFGLVRFGHVVAERRAHNACPYCTSTTTATRLKPLDPAAPDRIVVDCPLCGPTTCGSQVGTAIAIESLTGVSPAGTATLTVGIGGPPAGSPGVLIGEVWDKTMGAPFERFQIPVTGSLERRFDVPRQIGFDQHELHLLWVGELELAYARGVFDVLGPLPVDNESCK